MALFRTTICRLLNIYLTQKERVQFKIETEATHTSFSFKIKQDKKLCQSIKYDQKLIYDSLKKKTATLKLHTAKPFFTVTRGILTKLVSACFFFPVKNVFFFFRTRGSMLEAIETKTRNFQTHLQHYLLCWFADVTLLALAGLVPRPSTVGSGNEIKLQLGNGENRPYVAYVAYVANW